MKDLPPSPPPPHPSFLSSLQLRLQLRSRRAEGQAARRRSAVRARGGGGAQRTLSGCPGWPPSLLGLARVGDCCRAHPTLGSPRAPSQPGDLIPRCQSQAQRGASQTAGTWVWPAEPPAAAFPSAPGLSNPLSASARPGRGAIWPSCHSAGLCPLRGEGGLYSGVAPM